MNAATRTTNGRKISAIVFLIVMAIVFCATPVYADMPSYTDDEAVYAIETTSGDVVTEHNAHNRMYPASTTKMMTTLVALDYIADKMDETVTVGDEVNLITYDSSRADIRVGDTLTWEQMFYALLLPSGNDAALSIACHIGRIANNNNDMSSVDAINAFVELMNQKAADMGLEDSHFVNPHGLHDPNHYTTASDLVRISKEALKNKTIQTIVHTEVYSCHLESGDKKWINTNALIINPADLSQVMESSHTGEHYNASATGVKTGYTDDAKRCLVFSSDNGSQQVLGVILHSDSVIYDQANAIINTVNDSYDRIYWSEKNGTIKTIELSHVRLTDSRELKLKTDGQQSSVMPASEKTAYSSKLVLKSSLIEKNNDGSWLLKADLSPKQKIGTLNIYKNGEIVKKIDVISTQEIHVLGTMDYLIMFGTIAILGCVILLIYHNRNKNNHTTGVSELTGD